MDDPRYQLGIFPLIPLIFRRRNRPPPGGPMPAPAPPHYGPSPAPGPHYGPGPAPGPHYGPGPAPGPHLAPAPPARPFWNFARTVYQDQAPKPDTDDAVTGGPLTNYQHYYGAPAHPYARRPLLPPPPPMRARGRCHVQGDGAVYDETGQFLGYADVDDGDDGDVDVSEILGAADNELHEADLVLLSGDWHTMGASAQKLRRRIAKLDDRIDKLEDKSANMKGAFQRQRQKGLKRKIERVAEKRDELKAKLSELDRAKADVSAAAGAAGAAAATNALVQTGMGAPAVLGARDSITRRPPNVTARGMANMRGMQAGGGQRFQAVAPPGSGRLATIPFLQTDTQVPRNSLSIPTGGQTATVSLDTGTIPYALCKIVGFLVHFYYATTSGDVVICKDLKVAGGTPLFITDSWQDAKGYSDPDSLRGLRDYPVLQQTNRSTVDVAAAGTSENTVVFTCDLVVDVLNDDTYGIGSPGPYA